MFDDDIERYDFGWDGWGLSDCKRSEWSLTGRAVARG